MKVGSKIPPTDIRNVRDEFVFDNEISEVTIDEEKLQKSSEKLKVQKNEKNTKKSDGKLVKIQPKGKEKLITNIVSKSALESGKGLILQKTDGNLVSLKPPKNISLHKSVGKGIMVLKKSDGNFVNITSPKVVRNTQVDMSFLLFRILFR